MYKIVGEVKNSGGTPISGAKVCAFKTPAAHPQPLFTAITNAQGQYEISLPTPSGVVEYHVFVHYKVGAQLYTCLSMPYVQISG